MDKQQTHINDAAYNICVQTETQENTQLRVLKKRKGWNVDGCVLDIERKRSHKQCKHDNVTQNIIFIRTDTHENKRMR